MSIEILIIVAIAEWAIICLILAAKRWDWKCKWIGRKIRALIKR